MAANKRQRLDVLRATFRASQADVTVPPDCMPAPQFRIEYFVPPMRGYVHRSVDVEALQREAEAGRELMKEIPCSN